MSTWQSLLLAIALTATLYAVCVTSLVLAGRRRDAAALARFIPDCIVLFRRLIADRRVPSAHKLLFLALVAYLIMPFDLIPDFILVAGQLDDAILMAIVLRIVLRGSERARVIEQAWDQAVPERHPSPRRSATDPPGPRTPASTRLT